MRIVGDDTQVYTFGESLSAIRSIAYRLGEAGIDRGDRVAVIGENHPSWALAYLAIVYHGAVCVPLDPQGATEALANFIDNSEAKLAFVSADVENKFDAIQKSLGRPVASVVWKTVNCQRESANKEMIAVHPTDAAASLETRVRPHRSDLSSDFDEWASGEFPAKYSIERPEYSPDEVALLIYTSGTTGTPKGVPLTHGNIIAELTGIDEVLKLSEHERILSLLPLFHAYLQIVNLWVATTVGCEVGYLKELSPAELGSAMREFKPTILTTVPRLWYLFHKKIFDAVEAKPRIVRRLFRALLATNGVLRDRLGVNLGNRPFGEVHESFGGCLRIAISAGSRFDEDVARDFHRLGFTILQGYGLTETSGAATANFEKDNRIGSVGKPMRGTEIKIADPNQEGVGEVLIRGGVVFNGYYRNQAATADTFTADGWFRSGDLGRLDKDGHLYIVGRAKDVIVLPSGKNVHPEDLEAHYLKTPLVEELAIVGIKDANEHRAGAEKLAAVVVPDFEYLKSSNIANSKEAIRYALDDLGRELPEYQRVRDYMIRVEPLPRTATRKIKRFELTKAIETGTIGGSPNDKKKWEFTAADYDILTSRCGEMAVSVVRQHSKDSDRIHPDMNLEIDLGLDSLARAEMFAALEMKLGAEFSADDAARALTVRELIGLAERSEPPASADGKPGFGTTAADRQSEIGTWSAVLKNADDIPEMETVLRDRAVFLVFAFIVYKLFNVFCRVFMRLEVEGLEGFRRMKRPFLICPNHQSFLDPFVVCSNYPYEFFKNTFHVGASEFFSSRFMSYVARMLHVVPVDPDTQLMKAMKAGAIGLKRGKVLNIYPEGERAYDGQLHQFKSGAAILATELDRPIVPVAIHGLHKVWARRSMKIRPAKVKVRFGEPFYAKDILTSVDPAGAPSYQLVTDHLKRSIENMLDQM